MMNSYASPCDYLFAKHVANKKLIQFQVRRRHCIGGYPMQCLFLGKDQDQIDRYE